jgi:acetylglutamate kinase
VGDVTEVKVKLIKKEIADGFVPVISPVAEGYDGKPYNVNADLAAGRVASALRARRLVYMSDVPGLLANPPDPDSLISTLKISQVDDLKKKGVIDKGMRPKVGQRHPGAAGRRAARALHRRPPAAQPAAGDFHRPGHRHGDRARLSGIFDF